MRWVKNQKMAQPITKMPRPNVNVTCRPEASAAWIASRLIATSACPTTSPSEVLIGEAGSNVIVVAVGFAFPAFFKG